MLAIREQPSFAGGMFQSVAPERIPDNGAWDIENGLLDEDGSCNRRGGSSYYTTSMGSSDLTWIWAGYIGTSYVELVSDPADYGSCSSGGIANLGGAGRITPAGRAAQLDVALYMPGGATFIPGPAFGAAAVKTAPYYAAVANRLIAAGGNRVDFSGIGTPAVFAATDYHLLPDGVSITGVEGLRDSLVCFTTRGIYIIGGLAANLTDADGNVQHRIDRYSREAVLWGDAGIAGSEGGLIAPMAGGVWIISLGVASEAVQAYRLTSGPIEDLYRTYVAAGYMPGGAAVFRGHYILPILKPAGTGWEWADTLVCRLDMPGTPWTRATGVRFMALTATPTGKLLGAGPAGQVVQLHWFDGAARTDADGSAVSFRVRTRDMAAGRRKTGIVKLRLEYELDDGETSVILAADDFSSTVGDLDGETADTGGAWATSGAATDFALPGGGTGNVSRNSPLGTRVALLGPAAADAVAQVQLKTSGSAEFAGVVGRYVNGSNYAYMGVIRVAGVFYLRMYKMVAGAPIFVTQWPLGSTTVANLSTGLYARLEVDPAGVWTASLVTSGGVLRATRTGTDPLFATGGALASGQWGLVHVGQSGSPAGLVLYDDFSLTVPTPVPSSLDAYLVEGPTPPGYQALSSLGSAPANLVPGVESGTFTYAVRQSSRYGRFEFRCDDPASRVSLRRLEAFVRENGRQ